MLEPIERDDLKSHLK